MSHSAEVLSLPEEQTADDPKPSSPPPLQPESPQPDWSESEWFRDWLKLARREKK